MIAMASVGHVPLGHIRRPRISAASVYSLRDHHAVDTRQPDRSPKQQVVQ
jgi:hypothetical protein